MLDVPYLPAPTDEPDYSGRYITAGVLLLLIATLCGCFVGLIPVSLAIQSNMVAQLPPQSRAQIPPPAPVTQLAAAIGTYALMAAGAAWLGIGALQKRRWVRPLLLIFGVHGLIFGVACCVVFVLTTVVMSQKLSWTNPFAGVAAVVAFVIGGLIVVALFVGLPSTLLLLMRNERVQLTAERYDLRSRWTDDLPVNVLGLVVTLAALAVFELLVLLRPAVPMFTTFLTGWPAVLLIAGHIALLAWAAVLVYRRDLLGWWLGLGLIALPLLIGLASSATMPTEQYVAAAQMQPDAAALVAKNELAFRAISAVCAGLFLLIFTVYMLRLRPAIAVGANTTSA